MPRERPAMAGFRVNGREKTVLEALAAIWGCTVAELLRGRVFPWATESLGVALKDGQSDDAALRGTGT